VQVQVAANFAALEQQMPRGVSLRFAPPSALPGVFLMLKGIPAFQQPLKLWFTMQNRN